MSNTRRRKFWTVDQAAAESASTIRALEVADLPTVFQPIVDLRTGQVFAYEALVRCTKSDFASPIGLFDRAVEEHACGRLGRMIREAAVGRCPDKPLFLNVHPYELSERWLVRPDDPINFHPSPVYLEITETAAFEYFDLCMSVLREVCDRTGAKLVVDDFGAGYSNLMRVADLRPAIVKLDRAMITHLDTDRRKRTLVGLVVDMCAQFDALVIAEGIETIGELDAVRDLKIPYAQGYFLARPGYPLPAIYWPYPPPVPRRA